MDKLIDLLFLTSGIVLLICGAYALVGSYSLLVGGAVLVGLSVMPVNGKKGNP